MNLKNSSFRDCEKEGTDWKALLGLLVFAFLLRLPLSFSQKSFKTMGLNISVTPNWFLAAIGLEEMPPTLSYPSCLCPPFCSGCREGRDPDFDHLLVVLILPVFYLGKEMFDTRIGLLSGLFAAVHLFLTSLPDRS